MANKLKKDYNRLIDDALYLASKIGLVVFAGIFAMSLAVELVTDAPKEKEYESN